LRDVFISRSVLKVKQVLLTELFVNERVKETRTRAPIR
jgi:hypothetical protein